MSASEYVSTQVCHPHPSETIVLKKLNEAVFDVIEFIILKKKSLTSIRQQSNSSLTEVLDSATHFKTIVLSWSQSVSEECLLLSE